MNQVKTAVLLAAGFGKRLRPLTGLCAKPALPFFDSTLLHYLVSNLERAGIERVFINLHYMSESVRAAFRNHPVQNVDIEFSFEPEILGTAGVLGPLYPYLKNETFVMMNGDIVTDVNLTDMIAFHFSSGRPLATIALHTNSANRGYPQIGASQSNVLTRFPYGILKHGHADWQGTFEGVHVIRPEIYDYISRNAFLCINSDVYPEALKKGAGITVFRHDGYWNDIGNPDSYFNAHADAVKLGLIPGIRQNVFDSNWIHETSTIGSGTTLDGEVFIYPNCTVNKNVHLRRVILWPNASIGDNACLHEGIYLDKHSFYQLTPRNGL